MRFIIPLFALSVQLINAIEFKAPNVNSTLTRGSNFDLSWSTVDTDPTSFSIYLVNFVNWPPFYTPVKSNVETASGETKIRIPCDVDSSYGFQFNAINGTNLYVIYAQSPKFFITGDACTDPSPSPVCPPASTATVTVTVSGNSSHVATPTPTSTSAGRCPVTIGWNGGYSSAVTLTSVPAATGQPLSTTTPTPTAAAENSWGQWPVFPVTTVTRYHTVCPCEL